MIDGSEEKCWIGLQQERGGVIEVCTCHSYGGIKKVGAYLNYGFNHMDSRRDVEVLRPIVERKDVVPGMTKFLKNVDRLEPAGAEHERSESSKVFGGLDEFLAAFFKEPTIAYAYLFAIYDAHSTRHRWVCWTKVALYLHGFVSQAGTIDDLRVSLS